LESLTRFEIATEQVKLQSGPVVQIPKCFVRFRPWIGKPIQNTYGGKAVLEFAGEPVFAELAALRILQQDSWEGVWVDSFRRKFRGDLPERANACDLPLKAKNLFDAIVAIKGSRGGCWDVFAWRQNEFLFAESKRRKRDSMRPSQYRWLDAAIQVGLPLSSFLIVEWDLE
jgi:hypothetical protein